MSSKEEKDRNELRREQALANQRDRARIRPTPTPKNVEIEKIKRQLHNLIDRVEGLKESN